MNGDGVGDYFWMDPSGKGWGFLNKGVGANDWIPLGNTAVPGVTTRKRETIRMGVLTASHRADYIVVEEETGRAYWWENLGAAGDYGWSARGMFATGPKGPVESMWPDWGFSGSNVRFAEYDSFYIAFPGPQIFEHPAC